MSTIRSKLWLLLAVVLFGWWFFVGDSPLQLARSFVGRGRKLSVTTMRNGRDLDQTVDEVVAQVSTAMGRPVAKDSVIKARVSANENPGTSEDEKAAIQWVCKNDAEQEGWSQEFVTTTARGCWGTQAGRRYSTHGEDIGSHVGTGIYEIHEDDLFVAESIDNGSIPDPTGGATKFVHTTGYANFKDFLAGHPRVAEWASGGLVPVWLFGRMSKLVILLPRSKVTAGMDVTDPAEEASS